MSTRPASDIDRELDLLAEVGTGRMPHSGDTLLHHLRGTHDYLARWGCPEYLCAAGLFHSVYGTEGFPTTSISPHDRERVRARIGAQAEVLVHLYCTMVRHSLFANLDRDAPYHLVDRTTGAHVPIERQQLGDLLTLDLANMLEQLPRIPMALWRMEAGRRVYEKGVPLLTAAAVTDMRRVYRRRSWLLIAADGGFRLARRIVRAALGRKPRAS